MNNEHKSAEWRRKHLGKNTEEEKVRDVIENLKPIKDLEVEMRKSEDVKGKKLTKVILCDKELIEKCRVWIDKIFKIKDAAHFLNVPSDYNNDPDVLFFELIRRYKRLGELVEEAEAMMFDGKRLPENNKPDLSKFLGRGEELGAARINVGGGVDMKSENGKKMKNFLEKQKK